MAKPRVTATDRLSNVIEVVELGRRTGLLSVERGSGALLEEGDIYFVVGRTIFATLAGLRGREALAMLGRWGDCRFSFDPTSPRPTPNVSGSLSSNPSSGALPAAPSFAPPASSAYHAGYQAPPRPNSPPASPTAQPPQGAAPGGRPRGAPMGATAGDGVDRWGLPPGAPYIPGASGAPGGPESGPLGPYQPNYSPQYPPNTGATGAGGMYGAYNNSPVGGGSAQETPWRVPDRLADHRDRMASGVATNQRMGQNTNGAPSSAPYAPEAASAAALARPLADDQYAPRDARDPATLNPATYRTRQLERRPRRAPDLRDLVAVISAHQLSRSHRAILLLANGEHNLPDLARLSARPVEEVALLLQELEQHGLVYYY